MIDRCRWTENEFQYYEKVFLDEIDRRAVLEAARNEGIQEGFQKGFQESYQKSYQEGYQIGLQEALQKQLEQEKCSGI